MEIPTFQEQSGAMELCVRCPRCKDVWLHQVEVVSCFRDEEDGPGTEVRHGEDQGIESRRRSDIPGRRHHVDIRFKCEICGDFAPDAPPRSLVLRIQQHKGQTLMVWVST